VDLARDLRTTALWLAEPGDWLLRRLRGRPDLPPLWLRRHVGPVGQFEHAGRAMAELIQRLGLVREGDRMLDVGCGCGGMVPYLCGLSGPSGSYVGFDVHAPSIRWCNGHYALDRRLRFELAAVTSPYGDNSSAQPASSYRFPVADGEADFILVKSVFTHLLEASARHYLAEIRRTLRPGRSALVTAFLFDEAVRPPAFPHPDEHPEERSGVRWLRRVRPEAAVAYERRLFERMVAEAGLAVQSFLPGFWPGTAAHPSGQDCLIVGVAQA